MRETFQYISDMHIDIRGETDFDKVVKLNPKNIDKNLIIAGDVCDGEDRKMYETFIIHVCSVFENVYVVAGNHEYCDSTIDKTETFLRALDKKYPQLHYLQTQSYTTVKGNKIVGCTLWSYIPPNLAKDLKLDRIKHFSHEKRRELFEAHLLWLVDNVDNAIVVTHHSPSMKFIQQMFMGSITNYEYATNLEDLIERCKIWVFGHTHFTVSNGKAISNPMGYHTEKDIDYSNDIMFSV